MIFSKNSRKAPHLLSLLVAFAVAVGMWYVVSVRDRLEVQLEVGIEYNGIPSGLVVTDGLVSKVQVRLRGPEILLRSISSRSLTEAINLSNIKKGTIIVPVDSDQDTVVEAAKASEKVAKAIAGMQIVKVIHVKNKLVNLIVKPC